MNKDTSCTFEFFNFIKHWKQCIEIFSEQWDLNLSKKKTNIFSFLYLLEICRYSENLFVLKSDNVCCGLVGHSRGLKRNFLYNILFQIVILYIYIFYSRKVYWEYTVYNMYRPYIDLADGELSMIIVSKNYRNKGYGKQAFAYICNVAKNLGFKKLLISTYTKNCNTQFYDIVGCELFTTFREPVHDTYSLGKIYIKEL